MKIINTVAELQQELQLCQAESVGFVPTMGALHRGHLALVGEARRDCRCVVVSIFVNPTQFNDPNDLKSYPRQVAQDCELLEAAGVDYVFVPTISEIYPEPDTRQFSFGSVDKVMEGASRPGHFNGVAQVVSRLFEIVKPTRSYFGEKDFQQVAVIKAMVEQLGLGVEIEVVGIVREEDGLAMSSRNALLTAEYREAAPIIYKALARGAQSVTTATPQQVASQVASQIESSTPLRVIYFEIVDALSMCSVESWSDSDSIQGCIAVQAGEVRLIDNIKLK